MCVWGGPFKFFSFCYSTNVSVCMNIVVQYMQQPSVPIECHVFFDVIPNILDLYYYIILLYTSFCLQKRETVLKKGYIIGIKNTAGEYFCLNVAGKVKSVNSCCIEKEC